jgi:hypothetical protein
MSDAIRVWPFTSQTDVRWYVGYQGVKRNCYKRA